MNLVQAFSAVSLMALSHTLAANQTNISVSEQDSLRPNIVVILVDDMGYGDAKCYNPDGKISTPNIDAIAAAGMSFSDAHAAGPLCHLSRYGLLTGCYPFRAKPGKWATQPTIKEDQLTVPKLLKLVGYQTAMVGKWHLGFHENGYENPLAGGPIHRGFDSFFGIRASTDIPPYFYIRGDRAVLPPTDHVAANNTVGWSRIQGAFWREGGIAPDLKLQDVLPQFTSEAVSVIRDYAAEQPTNRKPLMMYLAYPAPHTPWLPSPRFSGKSGAGMYGDFMMMVDDEVGQITRELDAAGLADNTLLVFSSDNGPTWYDVDHQKFGHDCSGGLRGMKSDAWEGGHRVPFIVRWPKVVSPATTSAVTINFVDVLATLADVVGVPLPEKAGPDSFSFLKVLDGTLTAEQSVRDGLIIQSGGGLMTLRVGEWKLIDGLGSGGFSEPRRVKPKPGQAPGQLYDLIHDPGETRNVYSENPEVVKRLTKRMAQLQQVEGHRFLSR